VPDSAPEARLEQTEHGLVPRGEGWFVMNAREAQWRAGEGRGSICDLEGEPEYPQLGIHLFVLGPGEPMSMYHWEPAQEDFLVLSGEALLLIEGEERPLRQWDFVHCPPDAKHTVLGAGDGPCLVLAVGSRAGAGNSDWGGYPVDEVALRHNAGVPEETNEGAVAYRGVSRREPTRYRTDWLPEL
jgi:uncharacterized cupin superfamily protein